MSEDNTTDYVSDDPLPATPEGDALEQVDYDRDTGNPRLIRPFTIQGQGHWHIEVVSLTDRRPGVRGWYIQTEQKRPEGIVNVDERDIILLIGSRDVGSLHFRDGEDGSEHTVLRATLPRPWFGREWRIEAIDDKWGVEIIAWTTWWPGKSPLSRLRFWWNGFTYRHWYKPRSDRARANAPQDISCPDDGSHTYTPEEG